MSFYNHDDSIAAYKSKLERIRGILTVEGVKGPAFPQTLFDFSVLCLSVSVQPPCYVPLIFDFST